MGKTYRKATFEDSIRRYKKGKKALKRAYTKKIRNIPLDVDLNGNVYRKYDWLRESIWEDYKQFVSLKEYIRDEHESYLNELETYDWMVEKQESSKDYDEENGLKELEVIRLSMRFETPILKWSSSARLRKEFNKDYWRYERHLDRTLQKKISHHADMVFWKYRRDFIKPVYNEIQVIYQWKRMYILK